MEGVFRRCVGNAAAGAVARLASGLLLSTGMSLLARKISTTDVLAAALLAAELGEPYDTQRIDGEALRELFSSMAELHVSVPFATLRLLGRLANDARVDVRAETARALGWFVDQYPE